MLAGRVGTKVIHDMAVRTVIDLGYPLRDDLVIDTALAHQVAMAQTAMAQAAWAGGAASGAPVAGGVVGASAPYVVYPPPLFGRVDDPFFGFEPPLVSFPPWATSGNPDPRLNRVGLMAPGATPGANGPARPAQEGAAQGPIKGRLQLTVDMAGQVHLSGEVASEQDKQLIEEEARNTPGVSHVYSELRVAAAPGSELPPPPPQPVLVPDQQQPLAAPAGHQEPPAPPRPAPQRRCRTPNLAPTRRSR